MNNNKLNYKFLAKVKRTRSGIRCSCPGSEIGVIKCDLAAHEPDCWVRKRLLSGRYTVETFVIPQDF